MSCRHSTRAGRVNASGCRRTETIVAHLRSRSQLPGCSDSECTGSPAHPSRPCTPAMIHTHERGQWFSGGG